MANKPNKKVPAQPQPQPKPQAAPKPAAAAMPMANQMASKELFSVRNLCIMLGLISIVVYFNTIWNGFVMDDVMVLKDNRMVLQGAKAVPELLTTPHMRGYLIIPNDLYRPLSLVMFALEYELFGLSPAMHHLFNVLTFAGCSIMLFLFLHKFFDGTRVALAFMAALIFAVHPVHVEVVANIKSRDELMCFFFGFWSLNLYIDYMRSGKMWQLLLGVLTFYLAIISKETVIAFVGLVPIIFFIYVNSDKKRAIFISAGTLLAFAIFMGVRTSVLNAYDANNPAANVEFIDNALSGAPDFPVTAIQVFCTKVVVMGHYLKLMFLPYPLVSTYSYNAIPFADFASISFWLSLAANVALIYSMVTRFLKDRKDPWAFGILFYFATIFLFSNFPFLMGAELAERFAFFASAGTCLLIGLAIEKWVIKGIANDINILKTGKVLTVLAPLCLAYAGWAAVRNTEWKDNVTLYRADVKRSPNDVRLYHNIGSALAEEEYYTQTDTVKKLAVDEEALSFLRQGTVIYPGYADLYVEMARIYDRRKQYDSAVKYNTLGLKLNPINFTANNNLGSVYLTSGRYREAIPYFYAALQFNPNFKYSYINLAKCYQQLQQYDSAILNYRKYLSFEQNVDIYTEIGTCHFMLQRYDSSAHYYKLVLQQKPNDPNIINNIGAVMLNQQKYAEAVPYFQKAVQLNPNYFNGYTNLARAYYFSGQYQPAIETIMKEIQLDQQQAIKDIPYIALAYQKMGKMAEARQWEATSKKYYSNFKLE